MSQVGTTEVAAVRLPMLEIFLRRWLRWGFGGPYVVYVVCDAQAWLCHRRARTQSEAILLVSNHVFSS